MISTRKFAQRDNSFPCFLNKLFAVSVDPSIIFEMDICQVPFLKVLLSGDNFPIYENDLYCSMIINGNNGQLFLTNTLNSIGIFGYGIYNFTWYVSDATQ